MKIAVEIIKMLQIFVLTHFQHSVVYQCYITEENTSTLFTKCYLGFRRLKYFKCNHIQVSLFSKMSSCWKYCSCIQPLVAEPAIAPTDENGFPNIPDVLAKRKWYFIGIGKFEKACYRDNDFLTYWANAMKIHTSPVEDLL